MMELYLVNKDMVFYGSVRRVMQQAGEISGQKYEILSATKRSEEPSPALQDELAEGNLLLISRFILLVLKIFNKLHNKIRPKTELWL
jgi:hypothetical protein